VIGEAKSVIAIKKNTDRDQKIMQREIDRARAGRQKPVQAGSNPAGRNLMNAVASTDYQPKGVREGRAAHITAKARDSNQELERLLDLSGVVSGGTLEEKNV